jgi:hypothetical protein
VLHQSPRKLGGSERHLALLVAVRIVLTVEGNAFNLRRPAGDDRVMATRWCTVPD